MKTKICVLLAISALGASSSVFAGEAGVAGAISYQLGATGQVTNASAAIAVGKNSAYAGATTDGLGATEAFAAGSGGEMTFLGAGSIYIDTIAEDSDMGNQDNSLAAINMNNLDANGNLSQVVGPAPDLAPILVPAPAPTPAL